VLAGAIALASTAAFAQPSEVLPLSGAESFAILAKSAVTNAGASTVGGDVGVGIGGTIVGLTPAMLAAGSVLHTGDAVATQALQSAALSYADVFQRTCTTTDPVLDGASLAPGVYCFTTNAVLNTTLTLTGAGPWFFKVPGALTVAPSAVVQPPAPVAPSTCSGHQVFWQVGDADPNTAPQPVTIGADARVVGNLLAQGAIGLGAAARLDGRAISLGATNGGGSVTLAANAVAACSNGQALPTSPAFKVTGGGGINVPSDPTVTDPDATGNGFANYGFNGRPGGAGTPATGTFNYVNHVVAPNLHINGLVTDVAIVALNDDGTAKTARLSGTCDGFLPACTFSVLAEDNGEPAVDDRFGVTIVSAGQVVEARSLRQVRNGNIQFHSATLTTTVNAPTVGIGQTMRLQARLRRDKTGTPADAYVVLRLPGGQLLSWTDGGLVPGLVPIARNFVPVDLDAEVAALQIPPGTPPGVYTWLSALTQTGTLDLLTGISERPVTITP
jgi:hypothetical protein